MNQIKTSTIVAACLGTTLTGLTAYAIYFDYKRRNDPEFRLALKRESKRQARAAEEEAEGARKRERAVIRSIVDEMVEEGFETDAEKKEAFFMKQVEMGERLSQETGSEKEAAGCFFAALRVYPQPTELMRIYDNTVPKHILDILAEMEGYYRVAHRGGAASSGSSAAGVE